MPASANLWSNNTPHQGLVFHELVVLPTVAPHLAWEYHVPGTLEYTVAIAGRRDETPSADTLATLTHPADASAQVTAP